MRLEWIILAEGLGADAKGALTVIGLNQNVLITPTLPATTKRAILAHFTENGAEAKPGEPIFFRVSFVSPSGKTISAQNGSAQFTLSRWPDIPAAIDLPAEMILNCSEYGDSSDRGQPTGLGWR